MDVEIPYLDGRSRLVLSPVPPEEDGEWYINDHCFVEDDTGLLHFIGTNNPYPSSDPTVYTSKEQGLYEEHPYIGHATSTNPLESWDRRPHALVDREEGAHLGAPGVVWVDERSEYVMLQKTGAKGRSDRLELVTSPDLNNWNRSGTFVLPDLPSNARDPCIQRTGDGSFLLYVSGASSFPESSVFVTKTDDFETFEPIQVCLQGIDGLESPFVTSRNGLYYLFFTHAHRHYYETVVCVSERYDRFSMDQVVTTLYGHAAEIFEYDGTTYISSCGPGGQELMNEHGLYLAELNWTAP